MLSAIRRVLHELCHLEPKDLLLVGVSGGPDSLALMMLLRELDWNLLVAHLNHQLRPAANEEEEGVRNWSREMGYSFISQRIDVARYAKENALTIEEAARHCRYRFLFGEAAKNQAKAVLVAHTADDQAETVLMRLIRGAGSRGLSGMRMVSLPNQWSDTIPLVRPLLSIWRSQILEYLAQMGFEPFIDQSNFDPAYTRNRIRNNLLPVLEKYNPSIRKLLWQTAQLLSDEEVVLQELEELAWKQTIQVVDSDGIGLNLAQFRNLPQAMRRRLIRRAYQCLYPDVTTLEFLQVEEIINTFLAPRGAQRRINKLLNCFTDTEYGYLIKSSAPPPACGYPQLRDRKTLILPERGALPIDERWILHVEQVVGQPYLEMRKSAGQAFEAWLDFEVCKDGLFIRIPNPGDRFAPLSMGGQTAKLSDIFINRKVPVWLRKTYPLICNRTEILWLPGYTISHSARLTPDSRAAVHLRLLHETTASEALRGED